MAIRSNIIILYSVLGYFNTKNLISMNVDRCNILFSINSDGFNVYKVTMVIQKFFGQINTRKPLIVIDTFAVYLIGNENIFPDETESDCIYGAVCNELFDNFDTIYARQGYVSGIYHKYDINHTWYEKNGLYHEIDDMKHLNINCNCVFSGHKHNYNHCAKIWQRILMPNQS